MTNPPLTSRQIPGGWSRRDVAIGQRHFDLILPADPDEFLNELDEDSGPAAADPYWAAVWPAATTTAELVFAHPWTPGTPTLELGCGCGLAGLAGLAAGLRVTFSDIVPTAIEVALENARRNGFADAQGQLVDWRCPPTLPQYSRILGSDLLYEARDHSSLLDTLDRLLAGPGECWLGDPGRSAAQVFCRRAVERGYSVEIRNAQGQAVSVQSLGEFQLLVLRRTE